MPQEARGGFPARQSRRERGRLYKVWDEKAQDLAARFIKNFVKYTGNEAGKALVEAGPKA